jgi:hypothetical protein
MNPAHLWIGAAIVTGASGTFLQAIGAAKPENRAFLAGGTLLTGFAVYCLWRGQQMLSQQATAKPVLDIFVDGEKTLHVANRGTVDLEDMSIDETSYELKAEPLPQGRERFKITGIESFSKPSQPVFTQRRIPKAGGRLTFDLAKGPFPVHVGLPEMTSPEGRTVYCLRILFRYGVSKQRFVKYVLTASYRHFPDMFGESRGVALGGGYETSKRLFDVRALIRSHQAELFDDDPAMVYRD